MKLRTRILAVAISLLLCLAVAFILFRCRTIFRIAAGDIREIQARVDLLEEKALAGKEFMDDDRAFLASLYDAFVFGGGVMGYREASSMLGRYLENTGTPLRLDEQAFRENPKVGKALHEFLTRIREDQARSRLKTGTEYASAPVSISPAEDPRLFYAANWFVIKALVMEITGEEISVRYRVDLFCTFPSYQSQKTRFGNPRYFHTPFPSLIGGKILTVDDGLSHYLTIIGMAKEFPYYVEWQETYPLNQG